MSDLSIDDLECNFDWQGELAELYDAITPRKKTGVVDVLESLPISFEHAFAFVKYVVNFEDVFEAARAVYKYCVMMQRRHPDLPHTVFKKEADYPQKEAFLLYSFKKWFVLKYKPETNYNHLNELDFFAVRLSKSDVELIDTVIANAVRDLNYVR